VLALSEHDARSLAEQHRGLSVGVLPFPIGIDVEPGETPPREPGHLLFVGAMSRDVNVDAMTHFSRDVWPLVRREVPHARLTIVGNGPGDGVRRLAAMPGVEVTGFVPALEPYYARAAVFVAPLRVGGGIIAKNLDAMAAGCPVVTTTIGNEGIGATAGEHLLIADGPVAFARAVVDVLGDEGLRQRLADNARRFVRERFSLEASLAVLDREYAALAATR
jgi:glycosyltransferase involved in cell wall biosynthesis